jgi:hypothetical protein
MEHLTKQQIVLLTLLVGFVTSIASSIVTVSLLDQSAPAVTQTINRVVERTIEKATPSSNTKETIIVKEDQAIVNAIAKAGKGIVRIQHYGKGVALGIIVSDSGKIIAPTDVLYNADVTAVFDGGNITALRPLSRDPITGISVFQAEQGIDQASYRTYSSAALADTSSLKLGQSVVVVGGLENPTVASSIISSLTKGNEVFIALKDSSFDSQAILVNLLGEVLGIRNGTPDNGFIPSNIIKTYANH